MPGRTAEFVLLMGRGFETVIKKVWILLALWAFHCCAIDDSRGNAFFDSLSASLRNEYVACTGDASNQTIKFITSWKQKMDAWMLTPEYEEVLREYKKSADSGAAVLPCKLIEWKNQRKRAQDDHERALVKEVLDGNEESDVREELQNHPPSPFDFSGIPFGVPKSIFCHLFNKKFGKEPSSKANFLYIEDFPWNGRPFLTAFFFNANGAFCKYEIESDPLPADSLNRVVRPAAAFLAGAFEQTLGEANHSYRIGFYDIKSGELSPLKKWEVPPNLAYVGISVLHYRFYAKAIISNTILLQDKAEAGKKNTYSR